MAFLLYAVMESSPAILELPPGVGGATVDSIEVCGLTCWCSECPRRDDVSTRETALQFHRVVSRLFEKNDLIPFRFPTFLADRAEIGSEIERRATEYHDGLAKVRGRVQMEIRIQFRDNEQEPGTSGDVTSGTEYLRARYQRHVLMTAAGDTLRSATAPWIEQWRTREFSGNLRCFALIARGHVQDFQRALAGAAIASDLVARVSGPWPATEFLKED